MNENKFQESKIHKSNHDEIQKFGAKTKIDQTGNGIDTDDSETSKYEELAKSYRSKYVIQ